MASTAAAVVFNRSARNCRQTKEGTATNPARLSTSFAECETSTATSADVYLISGGVDGDVVVVVAVIVVVVVVAVVLTVAVSAD